MNVEQKRQVEILLSHLREIIEQAEKLQQVPEGLAYHLWPDGYQSAESVDVRHLQHSDRAPE